MTIAWAGWESYLAEDVSATDTTFVLGFDDDIPATPFDFFCGLERCTAIARPSAKHLTVVRGVHNTPAEPHYGGPECGIAEVRHEYVIYNNEGASFFCDLTAITESLQVDYVLPGGMSHAVISFSTYDPTRYFPDEDAILYLRSNESGPFKPYGKGYFGVPKETRLDDGGYHYELTFFGMMDTLGDDEYLETIQPIAGYYDSGLGWWDAFIPIHQVVTDAVRDLAFHTIALDFAHVVDGGQQIGKSFNGLWKTPLEIINDLCAQGDTGQPLDWAIFTGADGASLLYLYRRNRWPAIHIPWEILSAPDDPVLPENVPLSWNSRERRNRVAIKYGGGTMLATGSTAGRTKTLHRDVSNTVQDPATAYALAQAILADVQQLQMTTESPIVLQYKADDPATKYLTDAAGAEIALWRGEEIIGRMATLDGLTATNAGWPVSPSQVKTVHVDHVARTTTCQLGKFIDWTAEVNRVGAEDAKRPDSPLHSVGTSSAFAAPPPALPPVGASQNNVPTVGPNNGIGHAQVAKDADIGDKQWTYDVLDGTALPEGSYGDLRWTVKGEVIGWRFQGRSPTDTATSGVFTVTYGHAGEAPGNGALSLPVITLSGQATKKIDLPPGVAPAAGGAIPIAGDGDYLRLHITTNNGVTGFAHISLLPVFRRFEGSDRGVSDGGAEIIGVHASRDVDTGVVTFNITADRPCTAFVAFDVQAGPYRNVTGTTTVPSTNPKPQSFSMPSGVTMHGQVVLFTVDQVTTVGPDFTF